MGRAHISDVYDVDSTGRDRDRDAPSDTRTDMRAPSSSWVARVPPNLRIAVLVVFLGGGSGATTSLLGGLFDKQDPEMRRDVDANATAIAELVKRTDRCDAEIEAVAEDGREMQLWIASSMPMIANGLEIVGKAVGADVKISLPQLPGRGRR